MTLNRIIGKRDWVKLTLFDVMIMNQLTRIDMKTSLRTKTSEKIKKKPTDRRAQAIASAFITFSEGK